MSTFPVLKTGASAQYPVTRSLVHATRVLQFLDGSEQRYRRYGKVQHTWVVRLSLLDEMELQQYENFFRIQRGKHGSFSFTDPWSGREYANCSMDTDTVDLDSQDVGRGSITVRIRENAV
jgi:hypothetical protein